MTREINTLRFIPCDPEVIFITPDNKGTEYFISSEGETVRGNATISNVNSIVAYRKHFRSCEGRGRK